MSDNKKELDILDIATKTGKIIEQNFKAVMAVVIIAIVGGSVWAYMDSAEKAKQRKAFTELFSITKVYEDKKEKFAEAKAEKEKVANEAKSKKDDKKQADKKAEPKKDWLESTGDLDKDYPEVVKQLEAFVGSNINTNAAGEAALILSGIYDEYKMPDKGAAVLDKVLQKWTTKNVLFYVMQTRAGDLWAAAGQCEKSVSYWKVVANGDSFVAEQSQLKLGVCLQEIGQLDEAKTWFEKVQNKAPNSAEGFSAKRYLRYLEFKRKTNDQGSSNKAQQNKTDTDKAS